MTKIVSRLLVSALLLISSNAFGQNLLNNPESVVYDSLFNRYLVSNWEDGNIVQIDDNGVQSYFYSELGGNVAGLHIANGILYAAANNGPNAGLVAFDLATQDTIKTFYLPGMQLLNGIATDTSGYIYVTDYYTNVIYKADLDNDYGSIFVQGGLSYPNGAEFDAKNNRLLVNNEQAPGGPVISVNLQDSTYYNLVEFGTSGADGLELDQFGNCYISTWIPGSIWAYDSTFTNPPVEISTGHGSPADIYYDQSTYLMALPCFNSNSLDIICPFINIVSDTAWGYPPLDVEFSGSSTLNVTEWDWDFGNDVTDAGQSTSYIFQDPGKYDITLEIAAEDHNISFTENDYIIILADTVVAIDAQGDPGGVVEVEIYANTTLPLTSIRVPVEYSGPMGLILDSISTAGCRTEYFDNVDIISPDPINRTATFRVHNDFSGDTPNLEPGIGIVLKIYFTISPYAPSGYTNSIILDGYSSQLPRFEGPYLGFEPKTVSGDVSLSGICGDVDNNEAVNILDVTYLISYLYKDGSEPEKLEMCDANGDGNVNILDITYLISYLYKGGSQPIC